jgi:hypothetical protein
MSVVTPTGYGPPSEGDELGALDGVGEGVGDDEGVAPATEKLAEAGEPSTLPAASDATACTWKVPLLGGVQPKFHATVVGPPPFIVTVFETCASSS